jgi:tetratricopeptide (TPR) repeat protein
MSARTAAFLASLLLAGCGPAPVAASAPESAPPAPPSAARAPSAPTAAAEARAPSAPTAAAEARAPAALLSDRPAQIRALEELLARTEKTSPERPKRMRTLADAYADLAPSSVTDRGVTAGQRAIELYTALKDEHPSFCFASGDPKRSGCIDEVLASLAYLHEQAGDKEAALRSWRELIAKFPLSRHLPRAYVALGDRAFEDAMTDPKKLGDATRFFEKAASFPPADNPVAAYAHYKLGWLRFNEGDPGRAAAELAQAAQIADQQGSAGAVLAKAARKDLATACDMVAQKAGAPAPAACTKPP